METKEKQGLAGWIRSRAVLLSVAVLIVAVLIVLAVRFSSGGKKTLRPASEVSVVRVALPPPPPPPPVPRPEPKPVEPTPVNPQEMIVAEPTPEAPAEAPDSATPSTADPGGEAMGTNIQGDGSPNAFGLSSKGHGGIIGGTGTGFGPRGSGSGGSQWGRYTGYLQSQIQSALLRHKKTRQASLDIVVRLWPDKAGGMARAELVRSTGDAELDEAVQNEVLAKLALREPPPASMPLPIVMRISGERPL